MWVWAGHLLDADNASCWIVWVNQGCSLCVPQSLSLTLRHPCAAPPPAEHCVLPTLLACLLACSAVVNAVANWDWCTVAVFTCQNSCGKNPGTGQCHAAAEEVVLVTEAECESQAGQAGAGAGGADQQQGDDEDVSDG